MRIISGNACKLLSSMPDICVHSVNIMSFFISRVAVVICCGRFTVIRFLVPPLYHTLYGI